MASVNSGKFSSAPQRGRPAVLHLIDSLAIGGAERVAVNLVNHLPRDRYELHLCATRKGGPLEKEIRDCVGLTVLHKRSTFDLSTLIKLYKYVKINNIKIIHAHSSSILTAYIVGLFLPSVRLIWHVHFGRYAQKKPFSLPFRLILSRFQAIVAVSQPLVDWVIDDLLIERGKVDLIYNFSQLGKVVNGNMLLPGSVGARIVCVANLRPDKDHVTLLAAMATVVKRFPHSHLLLIGTTHDMDYFNFLQGETGRYGIENHVTFMGSCENVAAILSRSDVGVLSSRSEGLPLALIEYGMAGLPVVVTDIGQCKEVLNGGRCGMLVPVGSHSELAEALCQLLKSDVLRESLGASLLQRTSTIFGPEPAIKKICLIYDRILLQ